MSQTVLITGGTGFLGKHIALALRDSHRVVITGRNNAANAAAQEFTGCEVLPMDVVNIESVRDVFAEARPDSVIHAAATKFVDLSERQPNECIDVNVVGSQNIARVAIERSVKSVVGMSTDKAAPPVANTYGLTKALMERLYCAMDGKSATQFACVRHGNIAWSTGSVFPLWTRMQEVDGEIQSTGLDMTRFFSTVDDAVGIVLRTLFSIDRFHGSVVASEMQCARIRDILEVWVAEKGGAYRGIPGRPGERTYECLFGEAEIPNLRCQTHEGGEVFVLRFNSPEAPRPTDRKIVPEELSSDTAPKLTREGISRLIASRPKGDPAPIAK